MMVVRLSRQSCIRAPGPLVKAGRGEACARTGGDGDAGRSGAIRKGRARGRRTQKGRKVAPPPRCHIIGLAVIPACDHPDPPLSLMGFPCTSRGGLPAFPHMCTFWGKRGAERPPFCRRQRPEAAAGRARWRRRRLAGIDSSATGAFSACDRILSASRGCRRTGAAASGRG